MNKKMVQLLNQYVFKISSIIPFITLVLLYTFTIACSWQLGRIPTPSLNDPKDFGFDLLFASVFWGILATFYGFFIWAISYVISQFYFKDVQVKYLVLYGIGFGLFLLQAIIDPFNIIYWYLD